MVEFNFGNRVVDQWNILPEEFMKATSINSFKNIIDNFLSLNLVMINYCQASTDTPIVISVLQIA